jgi:uncharacterized protein YcgI (DUF1989 family)
MTAFDIETAVDVPGYSGRFLLVERGRRIRITDVCGTQIGDLFVLARRDDREFLSASVTRSVNWRLFPQIGQSFYSTTRRPILTLLEDHSPGIHDMLFSPCDQPMYEQLGVKEEHPNCRDNYLAAAREAGIRHTFVPDPVNLFQNTPADGKGDLRSEVTPTKPGDHVVLRAEQDIVVVLTACSVDIGLNQPNGGKSTPLRIEVLRAQG